MYQIAQEVTFNRVLNKTVHNYFILRSTWIKCEEGRLLGYYYPPPKTTTAQLNKLLRNVEAPLSGWLWYTSFSIVSSHSDLDEASRKCNRLVAFGKDPSRSTTESEDLGRGKRLKKTKSSGYTFIVEDSTDSESEKEESFVRPDIGQFPSIPADLYPLTTPPGAGAGNDSLSSSSRSPAASNQSVSPTRSFFSPPQIYTPLIEPTLPTYNPPHQVPHFWNPAEHNWGHYQHGQQSAYSQHSGNI